eukprot:Pompholyxophrys_sp_v1_NODE_51_length_2938_cov_13.599723.p1 type:complete len:769 gc:universal NODE_51_length_2938_cov_13.599723:515-2821(+)
MIPSSVLFPKVVLNVNEMCGWRLVFLPSKHDSNGLIPLLFYGSKERHLPQVFNIGKDNLYFLSTWIDFINSKSDYETCPGIDNHPHCFLVFKRLKHRQFIGMCQTCKDTQNADLRKARRENMRNEEDREKWTEPTSKVNFSILSDQDKTMRYKKLAKSFHLLNNKVRNLPLISQTVKISEGNFKLLNGDLDIIEKEFPDTLKTVLESDSSGNLKKCWDERKIFMEETVDAWARKTQGINSRKGARFNPVVIRIALAVYSRSPSAYRALETLKILPLPSESTLKSYVRNYRTDAGIQSYVNVLKIFRERFDELMRENDIKDPSRDIWLIFDEIKVCQGIVWNCSDGSIVGYELTHEDMVELQDIFSPPKTDVSEPAELSDHILLFLARSAIYSFQMVGPHYSSHGPFKGEFLKACLVETTLAFYSVGFFPTLSICDGGSANLSCIKSLLDLDKSAFRITEEEVDLTPVCHNFAGIKDLTMTFMICPPHMLKNMVNALETSRTEGTKNFMFDSMKSINWSHIYSTFYREIERVVGGEIRKVRRLSADAMHRDSWSKMNVGLAKVFIHGDLSAEMISHMIENSSYEAEKTIELLQHMEATFRDVFLNPKRYVYNMEDLCFEQLESADSFLSKWRHNVDTMSESLNLTPLEKSRLFLAWQTYDLWRIMVKGFCFYCQSFFKRHDQGNFYLKPIRMSGSAIELVFSALRQMKGSSASLTEAKFITAKANFMMHEIHDPKTKNQYFGNRELVRAHSARGTSNLPLKPYHRPSQV